MSKNASLLVKTQVPEFIREDSPVFIEFLEAYYEFLNDYNIKLETLRDVDQIDERFVTFLKQEFASKFPGAYVDDRKLIKIIKQLYRSKGTLEGVEFLFRIFFNEAVIIKQPGKQLLRASDGQWEQESSITLEQNYGIIDFSGPITLKLENDNGIFYIDVTRYEIIDDSKTRFFFKNTNQIAYTIPQYVDIVDSNDTITYRGLMVKNPNSLYIANGGKSWKLGQVIIINGTVAPTIAKVLAVDSIGSITALEIVQHGYEHIENQTVLVSPYPNKPSSSFIYDSTIIGVDGTTPIYEHTLTLSTYIDSLKETIYGVSNNAGLAGYFLENYVDGDYAGATVIQQEFDTTGTSSTIGINPDLTIEEWLASRATLIYTHDYRVNYKGGYKNDAGQISNSNIRLQDSYFWQVFSYVIETAQRENEYRNILNLIHPAGLKYFGELNKVASIVSNTITAFRSLSRDVIYADDALLALAEEAILDITKVAVDTQLSSDQIASIVLLKVITETVDITDQGAVLDVTKALTDSSLITESVALTVISVLSEQFSTTDSSTKLFDKALSTEISYTTDSLVNSLDKYVTTDSISADQAGTADLITVSYDAEIYFAEDYATLELNLNLG